MKVSVYYRSAAFRKAAGAQEELVQQESMTLGQALEALVRRHGETMRGLLFREGASLGCFVLVNGTGVRELETALADGDRLELLRFSAGG